MEEEKGGKKREYLPAWAASREKSGEREERAWGSREFNRERALLVSDAFSRTPAFFFLTSRHCYAPFFLVGEHNTSLQVSRFTPLASRRWGERFQRHKSGAKCYCNVLVNCHTFFGSLRCVSLTNTRLTSYGMAKLSCGKLSHQSKQPQSFHFP